MNISYRILLYVHHTNNCLVGLRNSKTLSCISMFVYNTKEHFLKVSEFLEETTPYIYAFCLYGSQYSPMKPWNIFFFINSQCIVTFIKRIERINHSKVITLAYPELQMKNIMIEDEYYVSIPKCNNNALKYTLLWTIEI